MASLRSLECLVTILEQGSLTHAAAVLHMSQSALPHQIAALERELGTPVIEARVRLAATDRAVMAGKRMAAGVGGGSGHRRRSARRPAAAVRRRPDPPRPAQIHRDDRRARHPRSSAITDFDKSHEFFETLAPGNDLPS